MIDDALTQCNEFGVAHVVLGVIGPPRADHEPVFAVWFEDMIDGGKECKAEFVSCLAKLGLSVVVGADPFPVQFFAGVEIMRAVVADGLVNLEPIAFADKFEFGKQFAIPLEMRCRLAPQPANIDSVLDT